ncbi:MAG: helix-turn-helix domain-containing protein [Nostoc sp.]|uniref:helix-turn-helix domain-containing protein n=1 Tax=Nostoc sp. TaxID=1180 RepID=UPI002FF709E3
MSLFTPEQIYLPDLPSLPLKNRQNLPSISCIYFVLENGWLVYIGRFKDLRFRWRQHHRYHDFQHLENVKIAWLEISEPSLLHEIEMALIAWFEPYLNQTPCNPAWIERLKYLSENPKKFPVDLLAKKMFCRLAVLMAEKDPQLSQRQLAKDTGLDITTINRLFTNNFSRVDVGTVEVLCNYFGRSVGELFEMRNPEDIPQRKTKKQSRAEVEAA